MTTAFSDSELSAGQHPVKWNVIKLNYHYMITSLCYGWTFCEYENTLTREHVRLTERDLAKAMRKTMPRFGKSVSWDDVIDTYVARRKMLKTNQVHKRHPFGEKHGDQVHGVKSRRKHREQIAKHTIWRAGVMVRSR
ncbi:MAG: hypothetical protein EYC62_04035 [Alphaproteobacteria bacterium]|nr:MAG: hypothetical protein EYC62_04035 [Alphaproteobacteria bacterium]